MGSEPLGALAVVGAGGHARMVADCAEALGWSQVDVFDDGPGQTTGPFRVGGPVAQFLTRLGTYGGVVAAVGDNGARLELHRTLEAAGARMVVLVHPRATVSRHARLGPGTVVFAGAVVNVGAELGRATIVNTGATVDHDCRLADGVHVAPGGHLAGGVEIGEGTWVGVGAAVREYVTIGNPVLVGAGATVVKSIADDLTVVGNPARPLER